MKLTFLFQPVDDLSAASAFYRSLGWEEAWREGAHTVAMQMPGVEVQLMLDDEAGWGPAGPMYIVENLDNWVADHPGATLTKPIDDIPGGRVAGVQGPGHVFYVFEMVGG